MYQLKVQHPLSPLGPAAAEAVDETLWKLFVAVGDYWKLGDDPEPYRLQFRTFLDNRIALNPIYRAYYDVAAVFIDGLIKQHGAQGGYALIFAGQTPPEPLMDLVRKFVSGEFIAMRLAFGGFRAFGAINYCGFFGGANIAGQPVPYRTMEERK